MQDTIKSNLILDIPGFVKNYQITTFHRVTEIQLANYKVSSLLQKN